MRTDDVQSVISSAEKSRACGVLLDFDGTLSEIVPLPEDARPIPGAIETLGSLAAKMALVAVVSSRPADFLIPIFVDSPAIVLIGHSGLERVESGEVHVVPEALPWIPKVREAVRHAPDLVPDGVRIEDKGLSIACHYRGLPELHGKVRQAVEVLAAETGLRLRPGRLNFGLEIPLDVDKGTVANELGSKLDWIAFAGDDDVDIAGFNALRHLRTERSDMTTVGIAVLSPESPDDLRAAADISVEGPAGLLGFLRRLDNALEA
jgi:trehalose 6-phosphate phosphatase